MSDVHSKGIESNVASVVGAICTSAVASIVHLVVTKSMEGAVSGFLQNRSTSFGKVMMYSQIARADFVVSAHVHSHMTWSLPGDSKCQLNTQCTMTQSEHRQKIL